MKWVSVGLYFLMLATTFFSSKFVLTSIGFRYPMVFQGWQTLVGFLIYRFFHTCGLIKLTSIDIAGSISLFPVFLFFTGAILTGSMALANIPILSYVAISGFVPLAVDLTSGDVSKTKSARNFRLYVSVLIVVANLTVLAVEQTFWKSESYFWLEVHCLCQFALVQYGKITDARFNSIDRQYYCYIFSLIVLLPASLYLQEAFEALNFEELYQLMFIGGSLVCAISGLMLHFSQSLLRGDKSFGRIHHAGLALVAFTSLLVFELDFYTYWSIPLALISVGVMILIPSHLNPEESIFNEEITSDFVQVI